MFSPAPWGPLSLPAPTERRGNSFSRMWCLPIVPPALEQCFYETSLPHTNSAGDGYALSRSRWIPGGPLQFDLGIRPRSHLPRVDLMAPVVIKLCFSLRTCHLLIPSILIKPSIASICSKCRHQVSPFFPFPVGFYSLLYISTFTYICPGGSLIHFVL